MVNRFKKILLIASLLPIQASAIDVILEINDLEPTHQDVVLGSRSLLTPTANDVLEYSSEIGFRIAVQNSNWRFSWLRLNPEADYAAGGRNNEYYVALDHPNQTYGTYSSVSGRGEIELDVFDLDYLIPITTVGPGSLTAFGGFRIANYDMSMNATYDTTGQVIQRTAENGLFGIHGGIEGSAPFFTIDTFRFAGHMAISLLSGDSEFTHSESAGNLQRNLSWPSTVTTVDARIDYVVNCQQTLSE